MEKDGESKAARPQFSKRCSLCVAIAPPCSSGTGSSCAVYLLLHTRVQCRINKHSSGCTCVTGMRHATSYRSIFFFLQAYIQERDRETELNTHTHTQKHHKQLSGQLDQCYRSVLSSVPTSKLKHIAHGRIESS